MPLLYHSNNRKNSQTVAHCLRTTGPADNQSAHRNQNMMASRESDSNRSFMQLVTQLKGQVPKEKIRVKKTSIDSDSLRPFSDLVHLKKTKKPIIKEPRIIKEKEFSKDSDSLRPFSELLHPKEIKTRQTEPKNLSKDSDSLRPFSELLHPKEIKTQRQTQPKRPKNCIGRLFDTLCCKKPWQKYKSPGDIMRAEATQKSTTPPPTPASASSAAAIAAYKSAAIPDKMDSSMYTRPKCTGDSEPRTQHRRKWSYRSLKFGTEIKRESRFGKSDKDGDSNTMTTPKKPLTKEECLERKNSKLEYIRERKRKEKEEKLTCGGPSIHLYAGPTNHMKEHDYMADNAANQETKTFELCLPDSALDYLRCNR